jgi:hypothetical protein
MKSKNVEQLYKTKSGDIVRLSKGKQFPVSDHREWMREMQRDANNQTVVIRVKDGHELWGYKEADLTKIN